MDSSADSSELGAPPLSCERCGELPDDLLVNTGRDYTFPDAFHQLTYISGDDSERFYRCRACGTIYNWIDLPQFYGSGNCAEERCVRLPPSVWRLLDDFFLTDPKETPRLLEPKTYFEGLPLDFLLRALNRYVKNNPPVVSPFVPTLVQVLGKTNDRSIRDFLQSYVSQSPERAVEVLNVFRAFEWGPTFLDDLIRRCLDVTAES